MKYLGWLWHAISQSRWTCGTFPSNTQLSKQRSFLKHRFPWEFNCHCSWGLWKHRNSWPRLLWCGLCWSLWCRWGWFCLERTTKLNSIAFTRTLAISILLYLAATLGFLALSLQARPDHSNEVEWKHRWSQLCFYFLGSFRSSSWAEHLMDISSPRGCRGSHGCSRWAA